jgi:nucleoside-diphosphate-sugar epimerase
MKLILGCGYLGSRVARLWQARGENVAAVTRSAGRASVLRSAGYLPIVADVTDATSLRQLQKIGDIDSVLYAVGFDRAAGKAMREVYVEGLRNTIDALADTVKRLIHVSTTGVHSQNDGSWINEDSPCEPTREGGRVCLEAESVVRQHTIEPRAIVLRLAGIYGPGRIPRLEELLAGTPILAAPEAWLNLIHVDDAARIVLAVEQQVKPPRTYLVSDGHPVRRREYYAEAARLLDAPPPVFAAGASAVAADRRDASDKRVNNARLMCEIDIQLQYSTYKLGLAHTVAVERGREAESQSGTAEL